MSGGSFNYLCHQLQPCVQDLLDMAADLSRRGMDEAAEATLALIHKPPSAALRELWRAVEWHRSNDSSEADVARAFAKWEKTK